MIEMIFEIFCVGKYKQKFLENFYDFWNDFLEFFRLFNEISWKLLQNVEETSEEIWIRFCKNFEEIIKNEFFWGFQFRSVALLNTFQFIYLSINYTKLYF